MAASEAAKEALFLRRFLKELGLGDDEPVELGMDNQAAIAISYNPELHSRTKHIDRRHFFVRECVENMQISVPFVKSVDNLATCWRNVWVPLRQPIRFILTQISVTE